jgi:hypothetical protein
MVAEAAANPYVGPRPFEPEDSPRFFGRAREIRDVVALVVAQRVVLLYSASGAGKSSLLGAGAVPELTGSRGFDVLPRARLRAGAPPPDGNVFVSALASSLGAEETSLADALAARPRPPGTRFRALVIDQFEELFTAHPERWADQPGLFEELSGALERDADLRLVLSIREDFLAQLDPFTAMLPGGFRTRFRLERLDRESALAAVRGPLADTSRRFAPGVAEALVDDLLRFRVDSGRGDSTQVEGKFVEPVQLQVACRTLWSDLPPDADEITTEHLHLYADVDQVLGRFYDEAVRAAARDGRTREPRIRGWVERTLITPGGTRAAAYAGERETAGLRNRAVRILEEKRLVRPEWRAGARWYELTHDRLIEPVRASNRRFARRRWQRTAAAAAAVLTVVGAAAGAIGTTTYDDEGSGGGSSSGGPVLDISALQVVTARQAIVAVFRIRSEGLIGTRARARVSVSRARTRKRVATEDMSLRLVSDEQPVQVRVRVPSISRARHFVEITVRGQGLAARARSLPVRFDPPPAPPPPAPPPPAPPPP